jgi:hypothetical protein
MSNILLHSRNHILLLLGLYFADLMSTLFLIYVNNGTVGLEVQLLYNIDNSHVLRLNKEIGHTWGKHQGISDRMQLL